jgi:SAM-dependent methyltransferase
MLKRLVRIALPRSYHAPVSRVYAYSRSLLYAGRQRHCPCCGGNFRRFLSQGPRSRPDARCPRCGSLERHRLLWLYLHEKTNLFSGELRVLHVAPELCFRSLARQPGLQYIDADLESPRVSLRLDLTLLPLADDSFDVVLCNHVLEHVPDDRKAMSEIHRVLRPGGWAILQAPVYRSRENTEEDLDCPPAERERRFGQADHFRIYGRDYRARLEEGGFQVDENRYALTLPAEELRRMSLPQKEWIYHCWKTMSPAGSSGGRVHFPCAHSSAAGE